MSRRTFIVTRVVGWVFAACWVAAVILFAVHRPRHWVLHALGLVALGLTAPAAPSLVWSYGRYIRLCEERRRNGGAG